jgi:tetratricopeptide (TPR) repeat protein
MKSSEDLLLAEEYIQKGGEYQRAIDILEAALAIDPDNQALKAALAKAEADRYPAKEKFALVKKGMSEAEVRALLGPVNLRNVKEYPERHVVAWFYKKADGGAAAVYFDTGRKKDATPKVYDTKYDAIAASGEEN